MNDRNELEKHYKSAGYKDLGWANMNPEACEIVGTSTKKQVHEFGRNLHLIACHDLKVFLKVDSGD